MQNFQNAYNISSGDDGRRDVGNEAFDGQQRRALRIARLVAQIMDVNDVTFERGASRKAFTDAQLCALQRAGAKAAPG